LMSHLISIVHHLQPVLIQVYVQPTNVHVGWQNNIAHWHVDVEYHVQDNGHLATAPMEDVYLKHVPVNRPLEIKRGKHGLGAFARGDLNSGRFIGTYVGQILTSGSADHTIEITQHNSLNYLFEVTPDNDNVQLPVFDAAYIGNATRFLNHKAENGDNVEAHTLLVNGEHQIGFFTKKKVKAREELFLDYGMKYWKEPR
ncbi:SET domain-containing protein, partial [Paxillus ammoniavirescens]